MTIFCCCRMLRIKLVTLDVTNTLLHFRTPVYEQYAQAGVKYGIKADPAVLKLNFKEEWAKFSKKHPNYGRFTGIGWDGWWINVVKGTFKTYAKTHDDDMKIAQTAEYLLRHFQTSEAWAVSKGARDFLQHLKSAEIKLGVISNFDPRLHKILNAMELNQYFDFVLTSYEVGCEKPHPKIFEEALKRGNYVDSKEALHIGDNVQLDYFAAKNVGWKALLLAPKMEEVDHGVDPTDIFNDFEKLKKYFKDL